MHLASRETVFRGLPHGSSRGGRNTRGEKCLGAHSALRATSSSEFALHGLYLGHQRAKRSSCDWPSVAACATCRVAVGHVGRRGPVWREGLPSRLFPMRISAVQIQSPLAPLGLCRALIWGPPRITLLRVAAAAGLGRCCSSWVSLPACTNTDIVRRGDQGLEQRLSFRLPVPHPRVAGGGLPRSSTAAVTSTAATLPPGFDRSSLISLSPPPHCTSPTSWCLRRVTAPAPWTVSLPFSPPPRAWPGVSPCGATPACPPPPARSWPAAASPRGRCHRGRR